MPEPKTTPVQNDEKLILDALNELYRHSDASGSLKVFEAVSRLAELAWRYEDMANS